MRAFENVRLPTLENFVAVPLCLLFRSNGWGSDGEVAHTSFR